MLCCCCGRIRRERLQHGYQQQAVQLAQLRLAQMQTGGAIRGPLTHGVCCSKIAEAEAGVSVNEKKWLVMHVHVQMRLDPWCVILGYYQWPCQLKSTCYLEAVPNCPKHCGHLGTIVT
jgi:hypothetical protein